MEPVTPTIVGHPDELPDARKVVANIIATRATLRVATEAEPHRLKLCRRNPGHRVAIEAARRGLEVWDVWTRLDDGSGGEVLGSMCIDLSHWLERGGPIAVAPMVDPFTLPGVG